MCFMKDYKMTDFIKVTAAILINDDKLLIAQRKPEDKLPNKWEFPGGKVENGETPEVCLKREMKEEFGIYVSVVNFLVKVFTTTTIFQSVY